jgi:DNA-binding response OmpR family regulator
MAQRPANWARVLMRTSMRWHSKPKLSCGTDRKPLDEIWGRTERAREHTLHMYMARLRHKLEIRPEAPRYLLTEPGAGYGLATELMA